ncbi:EAL domain-containing protein [Desertibaculum subflavum]|uniref:EAL domain-containing protein n=1 Tax=Desertibaculum subflavum TaxID=2268458 RepID=UPI0013C41C0D
MSPFVHIALIFSYTLLAAMIGTHFGTAVLGLSDPTGGYVATAALFLLFALLHEVTARRVAIVSLMSDLAELRRSEIERRSELELAREEIAALRRDANVPASGTDEMQLLKSLLTQFAQRMDGRAATPAGAAIALPAGQPTQRDATGTTTLEQLRTAIEENRVDLYLQPVVSLPQRRTRFYECFSRIRTEVGTVLSPDRYLAMAESAGLLATIDNYLLFRCVQVIRRVRRRSRDVGFFVNMTMRTLEDGTFVESFLDFLDQNPELADHIVFEFPLADFQAGSPAARAVLLDLAERRYRFSIDRVGRLDLDIDWLAGHGVRFVKIDAPLLLKAGPGGTELRALRTGLDRNGVDLVAEKVETEAQVADMLDLRPDFGQGWVFGEPRRSREES